jgi:CBS domain-containing protein
MSSTKIQIYHGSYLMPSLEHATVADAMHPGIMTCEPDATAAEVARMMASNHVHCIAVMGVAHDTPGESLAWGTISVLDLIGAGLQSRGEQTASSIARRTVTSVEPGTPLREAATLMVTHGATHLLVIDSASQRPVGMLSTLDVAGILAWGEA